jgi:uncharacterized protein (DUF1330 family)
VIAHNDARASRIVFVYLCRRNLGGNMPAYIVFQRDSTIDQKELDAYMPLAMASGVGHPVKVLAAYGKQEVLEGAPVEGVVIVEFPSIEAAKNWYDSPAYRAAREHRFKGAKYRAVLVEGV